MRNIYGDGGGKRRGYIPVNNIIPANIGDESKISESILLGTEKKNVPTT